MFRREFLIQHIFLSTFFFKHLSLKSPLKRGSLSKSFLKELSLESHLLKSWI